MKVLMNLSNAIQRFSNNKYRFVLFMMFIIIVMVMELSPIGSSQLKQLSGGTAMLDMHFNYNQIEVYKMFDEIGLVGRQLYAKLLGLDFVFALVFTLVQSLMITDLLKKVGGSGPIMMLNLLPFLRCIFDIVENCFILDLLIKYPVELPIIVNVSSAFTTLKWIALIGVIALILCLGLISKRRSMISNTTLKKRGQMI